MPTRSPLDTYKAQYLDGPGSVNDMPEVFGQVRREFHVERALYPGSYLHVTPSLFFPEVCYVDSLAGIAVALADPDLQGYVTDHKHYPRIPNIRCYQDDYHTFNSEPEESFDLLISLNAGDVSQACKRFLPSGGLLLVNDEHYDARRAFVDPDYVLCAAFAGEGLQMETSEIKLASYFKTALGKPLTPEMVESDAPGPPSRARFKPTQRAAVYLFKKH